MSRALVIVDIQRDYFPGGKMPLHEPEATAAKAGEVLEAFRAAGDPIVHAQHLSPAGADLGFKMTLVPDACAAPSLEHDGRKVDARDVHASFVAALGQFYATVTPADEVT